MLDNLGYNLLGLDSVNYTSEPGGTEGIFCPYGSCNWGCTTGCWIGCSNGCTTCLTGRTFGTVSAGSTPAQTL